MKLRKGVKEQVPLVYRGKFRYISTDGTKPDNVKKKLILPKEQSAPVKKAESRGTGILSGWEKDRQSGYPVRGNNKKGRIP